MARPLITLLVLALLVIAFAVTWLSIPGIAGEGVPPPASLFLSGLTEGVRVCADGNIYPDCGVAGYRIVESGADLHELKTRVVIAYGSAAAVIVLVGSAFGFAPRKPEPNDED